MQFHAKAREKGHQKCNTYSSFCTYTSTSMANSNTATDIHPQHSTCYIPVLKTYPANKAISMPLTVQSRDIILHNWSVTTPTLGCKHIKIIIPTVWFAISFMESFLTKLFPTLGTEKMFSVPSFFKCSYAFLERKVKWVKFKYYTHNNRHQSWFITSKLTFCPLYSSLLKNSLLLV